MTKFKRFLTLGTVALFAAFSLVLVACSEKEDFQPEKSLVGSWEAVASESFDVHGETVSNVRTWKEGDFGAATLSMFNWLIINGDASGKSNKGDHTWTLDEDMLRIKYGPTSNGFTVILDIHVVKISAKSLIIETRIPISPTEGIFYEKVTYARKKK